MSQQSITATEERSQERTYWVMKQMPAAVMSARDEMMADWHPDQQPLSIWQAVNDAMIAAALGHEHVAGDRQGVSAESSFLAVVREHAEKARGIEANPEPQQVLDDAMADWRKRAERDMKESMTAIPTNTGVCRLLDAEMVAGAIKVTVGARTIFGDPQIDQPWALGDGESKKLLAKQKRDGNKVAVQASRDGYTIITAVVEGMVPVDLSGLLQAWGSASLDLKGLG